MFDVVWANPDRELVGQRRARKEKEKERRDAGSSGSRSVASAETESSGRSRKPQSFLDSIRLKKKWSKQEASSFSTSSRLSTSSEAAGNRDSLLVPPGLASSLGRSGSAQYSDSTFQRDRFWDSSGSQNRSSQDVDSVLSKWAIPNSLATMLSLDEDTELELQPKPSSHGALVAEIECDSAPSQLVQENQAHGDSSQALKTPASQSSDMETGEFGQCRVPALTPQPSPQNSLQTPLTPRSTNSLRGMRTAKSPSRVFSMRASWKQKDRINALEVRPLSPPREMSTCWHAGEVRDNQFRPAPLIIPVKSGICGPPSTEPPDSGYSSGNHHNDDATSMSLNISGMQREILNMAAADQDTYWKRLTEEDWGTWADAALYKELEMERKRWLLSAMYSISPKPNTGVQAPGERHILSFFENKATASYIASLNAEYPVQHMSPAPLSSRLFPNVYPVVSRSAAYSSLSAANPEVFSDIYAQSLPTLVAASDIPQVLRNMQRILQPQGTLHLLLMDPSPVRAVTGPCLQAWLDEHLILNLERLFRCTSPTRLFPAWLRDAHFQLRDSAKVVCRFPAFFSDSSGVEEVDKDVVVSVPGAGSTGFSDSTMPVLSTSPVQTRPGRPQERLQCLVGQKLWQEIWGPYVTADRWWWEDEGCREESIRLGTVWEYQIVDAVKKERYVACLL